MAQRESMMGIQKSHANKCALCGKSKSITSFKNKKICIACIDHIKHQG